MMQQPPLPNSLSSTHAHSPPVLSFPYTVEEKEDETLETQAQEAEGQVDDATKERASVSLLLS